MKTKNTKAISPVLQFLDSARFFVMSNLVHSLTEGIHTIKCNNRHNVTCLELKAKNVSTVFNTQTLKMI